MTSHRNDSTRRGIPAPAESTLEQTRVKRFVPTELEAREVMDPRLLVPELIPQSINS